MKEYSKEGMGSGKETEKEKEYGRAGAMQPGDTPSTTTPSTTTTSSHPSTSLSTKGDSGTREESGMFHGMSGVDMKLNEKKVTSFKQICCPVDGKLIGKTGAHADTPQAMTKYGQRVYCCTTECAAAFKDNVNKFLSSVGDPIWPIAPDMHGLTLSCPECKSGAKLPITGCEPRVLLKHGQALWFCSFGCVSSFLKNPSSAFSPGTISTFVLGEHRASGLQATCPVTGKKINVDAFNHYVEFHNGQRIYTAGGECPAQLCRNLQSTLRDVNDAFVHPPQPSVGGLLQMCIHCPHVFVVNEEHTPRVQFKGGQNLYFHTNCCVDEFMHNPNNFISNFVDEAGIVREQGASSYPMKKATHVETQPSLSSSSSVPSSSSPSTTHQAPSHREPVPPSSLYSKS